MDEVTRVLAELEADPAFDPGTRQRGQAYARAGRVTELTHEWSDDRLRVGAVVAGTARYRTTVSAVRAPSGRLDVRTTCSCPMAYDCKHVVAVVASLRERLSARPADWRSVLDGVLDEASAVSADGSGVVPVAVELVLPGDRSFGRPVPAARRSPRVTVRALRRGASDRWVRSGMEWSRLGNGPSADPWPGVRRGPLVDPEDLDRLVELKIALLGRRGYLATTSDALDLHAAGAGVWRALDRLVERGIPLLCSDRLVEVRLSATPARLEVDAHAEADAVGLRAGVVAAGSWFDARDVGFVGEPPHGVVLRSRSTVDPTDGGGPPALVLARLDRSPAQTVQDWVRGAHELRVDRAGVDELVQDYLPALARTVPVTSRDGSVPLPGPAQVRLRGEVTWEEDGRVELGWRWLYRRGQQVQQFPVEGSATSRGWRDRDAEVALVGRLGWGDDLDALLSLGVGGPGTLAGRLRLRDVEAMRFATQHLPRLAAHPDLEIVTNGAPPEFREVTGIPEVRFRPRGAAERKDRTDWLDLEVVVSVDDEQHGPLALGLPTVLAALATGETRVMIRPGVYVDLDRPGLDRLARLVRDARAVTDQPADGVRLTRQAHGLLADVHELGATEGQLTDWAEASAALRGLAESGAPLPSVPLPGGLRATLRPYQADGYAWLDFLRRHRLGGVLGDDMGLGKTLQTLAMISRAQEEAASEPTRRPFLVVAPSSVVETWRSEAERFTPDLGVVVVGGSTARRGWPLSRLLDPAQPADVVVTTYTLLRLEAEQYAAIRWAGLVLDEAQTVKNFRSKGWAAVRDLEADCRFALTGTPLENNLMELWSILALSAPGLFPHAESFRNTIANPVEQHADPEALAGLLRRIRPVLLRRTKELVATDLPPKQEQLVSVELSPRHRRIYDTHLQRERQRVLQLLDDLDGNRITILASLTRLRQLSLDPALVDPAHETVGSAKIDELLDRLAEVVAEGHRALVFSQFTGFLARVRRRLEADGIGYAYLDGRTRGRARVVDDFRSGTDPVFLISLKAGGVGLNLAEADYCFVLDPWWNPAVEAQAVDRVHRIGQTRPVLVYRLVAADTVEQKVVQLAARKAELFRSVLDGEVALGSRLTVADIASLVG